jgi:hypothetical protein
MAKMTMLEITQDILNDIDGDFVNSIDDTEESTQVAQIVKSTYLAMMSNRNWAHTRKPIQLTPTTDLNKPTHVIVPEKVKELYFINYNAVKSGDTKADFKAQIWREPDEFLQLVNYYDNSQSNVTTVIDNSGIVIQIKNDEAPSFYTSFDDRSLVFNAFDSEVESNLTSTKMQSMAYVMPDLIVGDSVIPDLPDEAFSALVEAAKSKCSWKLRQVADPAAQAEAKRQNKWLARKGRRIAQGFTYPNYGRKR